MGEPMYLIWSHEHRAWWRPNQRGYTTAFDQAGVYSCEDAREIVDGATHDWTSGLPNELPVRIEDLPERAQVLLGQA